MAMEHSAAKIENKEVESQEERDHVRTMPLRRGSWIIALGSEGPLLQWGNKKDTH